MGCYPKSQDPLITWSWNIMWQAKTIIFTITVPMATKLGRMVTYLNGLLTIKSHYALVTWSCIIMWQTKIIISLLPQCLWPPNLVEWWHYSEKLLTIKFWSRGLASSRDKQISFYLYYKSAYDNQTWNDNFPWWAPTMLHDPLITRPCKIRGSRTRGGSACKCLIRHRLIVINILNI